MDTSCVIYLSGDSSYIILKYTGDVNRKIIFEYTVKAHASGKKQGIKKYLVDMTDSINTDSDFNTYNFACQDMNNSDLIDRKAIAALLVSPDDHSHDYAEAISLYSGLNTRLFRDYDKAVEHLKKY